MRRDSSRHPWRRAAGTLLAALLCLPALRVATPPAFASDVRLHYEDAMEDVPATEASEKEIKAAFLLRFPDFVHWNRSLGDTLHIGVIGDDALYDKLLLLAEQENRSQSGTRRFITILRPAGPTEARLCEMLVLGEAVGPSTLPTLKAAHEAGTLTVGAWNESRGGTVIRLFREGSRVRFDISRTLAEEAGLRISSKLLNLAASSPMEGLLRKAHRPGSSGRASADA